MYAVEVCLQKSNVWISRTKSCKRLFRTRGGKHLNEDDDVQKYGQYHSVRDVCVTVCLSGWPDALFQFSMHSYYLAYNVSKNEQEKSLTLSGYIRRTCFYEHSFDFRPTIIQCQRWWKLSVCFEWSDFNVSVLSELWHLFFRFGSTIWYAATP